MVTPFSMSMRKRLEYYGYRFVHLFGNVYLIRNDKARATKILLYGIAVLRKGE